MVIQPSMLSIKNQSHWMLLRKTFFIKTLSVKWRLAMGRAVFQSCQFLLICFMQGRNKTEIVCTFQTLMHQFNFLPIRLTFCPFTNHHCREDNQSTSLMKQLKRITFVCGRCKWTRLNSQTNRQSNSPTMIWQSHTMKTLTKKLWNCWTSWTELISSIQSDMEMMITLNKSTKEIHCI